jgi:pyrimidine 5'-nucleotidase
MRFTTFFFDLDETLYPSSSGLWIEIRTRINAYMHERLGLSWEEIETVREQYFKEYGTTLRGLQANYQVAMDDYLAYVHNVPLEPHLKPNPELRAALEGISARKLIFTNADCAHADRVTKVLGLEGVFEGCIDVHVIAPRWLQQGILTRGTASCSTTRDASPGRRAPWACTRFWWAGMILVLRLTRRCPNSLTCHPF